MSAKSSRLVAVALCFLFGTVLFAQRVDKRQTHIRLLVVDYVVTSPDGSKTPAHAEGMLGYVAIYRSDDSVCLVEYVAAKRGDLAALRGDRDPRIRIFDKARAERSAVEAAAREAGFSDEQIEKFLDRSLVAVQ